MGFSKTSVKLCLTYLGFWGVRGGVAGLEKNVSLNCYIN